MNALAKVESLDKAGNPQGEVSAFKAAQWKPGQSGNPQGSKKGSRHNLTANFLFDLQKHWQDHGEKAIQKVYEEKPVEYVKIVASLVPKEMHLKVDPFEGMSYAQLIAKANHLGAIIDSARAVGDIGSCQEDDGS